MLLVRIVLEYFEYKELILWLVRRNVGALLPDFYITSFASSAEKSSAAEAMPRLFWNEPLYCIQSLHKYHSSHEQLTVTSYNNGYEEISKATIAIGVKPPWSMVTNKAAIVTP